MSRPARRSFSREPVPDLCAGARGCAPGRRRRRQALPRPASHATDHGRLEHRRRERRARGCPARRPTLNRPLTTAEGELALVVGGLDVTAVSERSSSRIVYRPSAVAIPAGETEIAVYRRSARGWTELRRFTARVRQPWPMFDLVDRRKHLGRQHRTPRAGTIDGHTASDRRTFQDFGSNAGLRSAREGAAGRCRLDRTTSASRDASRHCDSPRRARARRCSICPTTSWRCAPPR